MQYIKLFFTLAVISVTKPTKVDANDFTDILSYTHKFRSVVITISLEDAEPFNNRCHFCNEFFDPVHVLLVPCAYVEPISRGFIARLAERMGNS
jgi:hypothetical protein